VLSRDRDAIKREDPEEAARLKAQGKMMWVCCTLTISGTRGRSGGVLAGKLCMTRVQGNVRVGCGQPCDTVYQACLWICVAGELEFVRTICWSDDAIFVEEGTHTSIAARIVTDGVSRPQRVSVSKPAELMYTRTTCSMGTLADKDHHLVRPTWLQCSPTRPDIDTRC